MKKSFTALIVMKDGGMTGKSRNRGMTTHAMKRMGGEDNGFKPKGDGIAVGTSVFA